MKKLRLLSVVYASLIGCISFIAHAEVIQLSGELVFDAGRFPETFGEGAAIETGSYLVLFDPAIATQGLYSDYGSGQTSNFSNAILSASIDYAGVKYSTDAPSSLRNEIAVWDQYASGRDRLNFVIGLGSVSAGAAGIVGDDIIYQGVTYRPQNDVSVSPLRTTLTVSLRADDFSAISSTDIPSISDIETLFSSAGGVQVSSLYGSNGEFLSLGGDITTVNVSVIPSIMEITIDIKPWSNKNNVNPKSRGNIWVAVLSDENFDPLQIHPDSVRFGPSEIKANRHKVRDINRDGVSDLLVRFKTRKTGIECGDTEATLIAENYDGLVVRGKDSIKTTGCSKK